MGNGLKKVAKSCGGITIKAKGETVRYNADSDPVEIIVNTDLCKIRACS